ncbi:MAG TPA: choice-of-anchor D domain-containing protein [Bryobacteraceae bacterium]
MRLLLAILVACLTLQAAAPSLPSDIIDAQYSQSLGEIVLISSDANALYLYDPASGTESTIPLSYAPLGLSVSPDGDYAAVLHDGWVSYVNLQSQAVELYQTGIASGSIVLSAEGIYVFPDSQDEPVFLNFAWGPPFGSMIGEPQYISSARLDPVSGAIYGISNPSPANLFKIDFSSGIPESPPVVAPADTYHRVCGNVWLSPDGNSIYTGCGTVFKASDMSYSSSLGGLGEVQSLSVSTTQVAAIPSSSDGPDTEVWLYSSTDFSTAQRFVLPDDGHGKWVFFNQDGSEIYVIAEVGSSYELDTIDPTDTCTTASFSPGTAVTVAASGALEDATIQSSPAGCVFQATSNNPDWISLVSGNYGSGDTTLRYVVRPNPSSASRTGSITLASGLLTITQLGPSDSSPGFQNLSVNVVAADYSKTLDKLVYVSAEPNELHLYDPDTQADTFISLAYAPTSLSVDPNGYYAAVGHDGWISYVDLQATPMTVQVFPIAADVTSLALGGGYIYAFSSWDPLDAYTLQISDGTITSSLNVVGQISRLFAYGNTLYLSGGELAEWDLAQNPPIVSTSSASTCGNLWLSADASRIYTACANAYNATDFSTTGLLLSEAGTVQWAADSTSLLAVVPLHPPDTNSDLIDSQLQIYSDPDLSFIREEPLPSFSVSGTDYTGHGKYAFWNNSQSELVVVEQADSSAHLLSDYGVYTTSTCSYSVNPSSIPFTAAGGSGTISVSALTGCSWSAQAPFSWIQITGGSGTANGTVSFTVALNSGPNPRSGTITVGGQSVTVSQAAMPLPQVSASGLNFGSEQTGSLSASQTVTITNIGSDDWSLGIAISGSAASDFQKQTTCPTTLLATASCSVTIAFLPSATGSRSATLTLSDNTYGGTQSVALTGTGVLPPPPTPTAQVALTSLTFGSEATGIPSPSQSVTFTDTSSVAISFAWIGISGSAASDFRIQGNSCETSLPGGDSCRVTVEFLPTSAGTRTASLTFSDNASGSSQTVSLNGIGTQYLRVSDGSMGPILPSGDFDGDGRSDFVVWRPSNGTWYITASGGGYIQQQWGLPGDVPVSGDFNGDKRTDFAVWRPSDGSWYVLFTSQAAQYPAPSIVQQWGLPGDIPVPGDYNGDGKTDFAVWRPSLAVWYVLFSNQASQYPVPSLVRQWGFPGDIPVPGDYDGDGKTDFAVWRPSNGTWYIIPSSDPQHPIIQQWGLPGDIPVPGDYDGDGRDDFALWRPSNGSWYVLFADQRTQYPAPSIVQQWGLPADLPQAGDFDGSGKASFTVVRPSTYVWYVLDSDDRWHYPAPSAALQWGLYGDLPQ